MASKISAQRRKSEKWLLPQTRSRGSQKNGFRNPRSTQEVRKMTLASSRSGGSQENGFRNPRSTQEVRKMTPASKLLGGKSGKWLQKSPLNVRSQKNDSCLKAARGEVRKMASEIPAQCRKSEK
ncbi:hypothetical protein V8G54_023441 [Vigna mungo]|uniref:Uncharacterized protein n=1 Tax=Vigna mungo TaxID=3915 RepID=A0AAQ3N578_VIGMU